MPNNDVHPDLRRVARLMPRSAVGPRMLPLLRRLSRFRRAGAAEDVEVITLPSGAGARLFRPVGGSERRPALLWIHGGGYVLGDARQDDALCRRFSRRLGIVVASVEYRLAPENPYPTPVEDCYSVLSWLSGLPGVDPERVAIGGASAGGGLAATLALLARDRGELRPAFQLLVYPMLDDRSSALAPANSNYRLWSPSSNRFGWACYLGDADPEVAVPARRTDLSGLPPAWIGVGGNDLFRDEDLAYAERLSAAGVPCQFEEVPGAFHGFDVMAPKAVVSQDFFGKQCDALRSALVVAA